MTTGLRAIRRLSAELVRNLQPPSSDEEIIPVIGQALSLARGRPVRLRKAVFPPLTASGVWVDRANHDLIVFEENTDPEHQIVIIGHETWHMFQGHGGHGTRHGPNASRTADGETTGKLAAFVAAIAQATQTDLSPAQHMDAALHFAGRTDGHQVQEELEAEHFGFRFATDVQAALEEARAAGDPRNLTGRIQATMAHRFRSI